MSRESLKGHLKLATAAALDNPTIKCFLWLPRTIPMTTGIVILLCSIQGFANPETNIEDIRATWGNDPEKPFSWLTHAFLHTDKGHLALNLMAFWTSGGLVELYLGKVNLAIIILFTAIAAGVISGIAVPEYWDTKSNPIGFSAVAQATFVIGVYMGGRVTTICLGRALTSVPMLRKLRGWPWATFGTPIGIAAAGIWLTWAIAGEWNNPDAAPRVAHSFGMLTGAVIAMLIATVDREGKIRLGKPLIGFAITVTIIAILAKTLPQQ